MGFHPRALPSRGRSEPNGTTHGSVDERHYAKLLGEEFRRLNVEARHLSSGELAGQAFRVGVRVAPVTAIACGGVVELSVADERATSQDLDELAFVGMPAWPACCLRTEERADGAGDGVRTRDLLLGKQTLCRLSYSRGAWTRV